MLEILKSHGWKKAFAFASNPTEASPDADVFRKPFTREDVSKIIAIGQGGGRNPVWMCLCRLNDRRYAMVYAGPDIDDPTWERRGYGWVRISFLLTDMIRFYMGADSRTRPAKDIREFVHSSDAEDSEKEAIAELVLERII